MHVWIVWIFLWTNCSILLVFSLMNELKYLAHVHFICLHTLWYFWDLYVCLCVYENVCECVCVCACVYMNACGCIWMCMYVCECMVCVCVCLCGCGDVEARSQPWHSYSGVPSALFPLRRGFLLSLNSPLRPCWLAGNLQESAYIHLAITGTTSCTIISAFTWLLAIELRCSCLHSNYFTKLTL